MTSGKKRWPKKMSITYASQNDGFDEQKRNFSFESVFNEYNE